VQEVPVDVKFARCPEPRHFHIGIDAVNEHPPILRGVERAFVDQARDEIDRTHLTHQ
jgi:hypothetical protein